jgi:hypothetical protein
VQKFDNDGNYLGVWQITSPFSDMEAAPDGTIEVFDAFYESIEIYSSAGDLLGAWSPGCSPPHEFPNPPASFAIRSDGSRCFITGRVHEYASNGVMTGIVEVPAPTAVACGSGDLVFVATGGKVKVFGERIDTSTGLDTPAYAAGRRIDVLPNPFNGGTRIRYELGGTGPAIITVFDVRGRRVRELLRSDRAPVSGFIDWDGHDSAGKALPSGIYFVRLETPAGSVAKKAMLLR